MQAGSACGRSWATIVELRSRPSRNCRAAALALSVLPQRDSDDFQLGPTDSSRAVDVVPMYWMQRGRAERRFCYSS